ncbi:glycosyltransferase [Listeria grandensis]|uniref:Glycosyltransferase n=1 Tax=Listeria grandensis TaxID=1494963 RepID=A0A7X1CQ00_9LIST|nr:glycosyltransferase [Listeria grandensis]MBC1936518.1 glycosyltransferase [Listeria grandensis]
MIKDSISYVIPMFNAEKHIKRCIDSILSSDKNANIIIVDDGSTDNADDVLAEYIAQSNIRIFKKENGGPALARNYGLQFVLTEFVSFVDADDYLLPNYDPNKLIMQLKNTDWLIFGYESKYSLGKKVNSNFTKLNHTQVLDIRTFLEQIYVWMNPKNNFFNAPWNKIYKMSIIKKHKLQFDKSYKYTEDVYFNICYLRHVNTVTIIPDVLYGYCLENTMSESRSGDASWWHNLNKAHHYLEQLIVEKSDKQLASLKEYRMFHENIAIQYLNLLLFSTPRDRIKEVIKKKPACLPIRNPQNKHILYTLSACAIKALPLSLSSESIYSLSKIAKRKVK